MKFTQSQCNQTALGENKHKSTHVQ